MKSFSKVLAFALTFFTFCIGFLFAQDGDKLVVTSNVPSMEPVFGIQGSFDRTSWTDGSQAGAEMHCNLDITPTPTVGVKFLNVYFRVFQTNQSRFKGGYSISVTATPSVNTDTGMENYKTDAPNWFYDKHTTGTVGLEITPNTKDPSGVGPYGAAVTYTTGSPVAQGTEIFTIAYGWQYKENLPAGNYKATVTLSVSSP